MRPAMVVETVIGPLASETARANLRRMLDDYPPPDAHNHLLEGTRLARLRVPFNRIYGCEVCSFATETLSSGTDSRQPGPAATERPVC
jgi:hypothetical protein